MSGIDYFGMFLVAAMVVFFVLFAALMSNLNFQKILGLLWSYKGRINRKTFWVSYLLMFLVISLFRAVDQEILIYIMPEYPIKRITFGGISLVFKKYHTLR